MSNSNQIQNSTPTPEEGNKFNFKGKQINLI